jgi:hypothetical protein
MVRPQNHRIASSPLFYSRDQSPMSFVKASRNTQVAVGVLVLSGICAAALAHWCMSSGIGVTPDSVVYLSAADRLVDGKGLTPIGYHYAPAIPSGRPLISFPPAYPLVLTSTNLFTSDRLVGAKYIHTFLVALTVFLLGSIVYVSSRSIWPALFSMGLFQTSYRLWLSRFSRCSSCRRSSASFFTRGNLDRGFSYVVRARQLEQ